MLVKYIKYKIDDDDADDDDDGTRKRERREILDTHGASCQRFQSRVLLVSKTIHMEQKEHNKISEVFQKLIKKDHSM